MDTTTSTTATPAPAPTADDHARLNRFLSLVERLGIVALHLAPAFAAPFIKNEKSQAVFAAEVPIVGALADALTAGITK